MKPKACRQGVLYIAESQTWTLRSVCTEVCCAAPLHVKQSAWAPTHIHTHACMQECGGGRVHGVAPDDACPGGHKDLALELRQHALPARPPGRVILHSGMP